MASKLWVASRILGSHAAGGPFGKPLTEHTPAEIDFILEMGAKDEPERFTFRRFGTDAVSPESSAAWFNSLTGDARREWLAKRGSTAAQRRLDEYKKRKNAKSGGMVMGLSKGGKAVPVG